MPGRIDDHDDDDSLMSRLLAEAGIPAISPRPEFVSSLRSLMLGRLGPPQRARRRMSRLLVGSGLAVLGVAATALFLTLLRPANVWAQVAKALQARTWVHTRITGPDSKVYGETWFGPKSGVIAFRHGPEVEYHDQALGTFTKYVAAENVIYRLPETQQQTSSPDLEFYRHLLDTQVPARSPFPGSEIVAQTRRDIVEDGRSWADINLTLRVVGGDREQKIRFRVDPATKLPHSSVFQSPEGEGTALFDYPDRGPSDIYDLGAPRSAKLVDRTPGEDLDRVLAGLKAGRVRFDDYRAIFAWDDGINAHRVWRKGRKWRVETLLPGHKKSPAFPRDAVAAWWKDHQGDFLFMVSAVCDGERVYYYHANGNPFGPDVKQLPPLKLSMTQDISRPDEAFMPWPTEFAEHLSHPAIWQPTHDREFLLDPKPVDGPPGTIRVRVRDTRFPQPEHPDLYKLWIDPAKSYVAVRSETSVFNPGNPSQIAFIDTMILEDLARSPGGIWYPTRVRRRTSNLKTEQVWRYHLDFEAKLPDEMFRPVK